MTARSGRRATRVAGSDALATLLSKQKRNATMLDFRVFVTGTSDLFDSERD